MSDLIIITIIIKKKFAFGRSITKSDNPIKSFSVTIKHQGTNGERKPLDIPTI